jgi:hypothetical protein
MIDQEVDDNITSAGLQENRHGGLMTSLYLCDEGLADNELIKRGWAELVSFEVAFLKNWKE